MKQTWAIIGRTLYWLAWPIIYLFLAGSQRTRIVVYSGDKVLMVKNWLGDGRWKLPGGGIRKDEGSLQGAIRELREETGISADPKRLAFLFKHSSRSRGLKLNLHCYALAMPTIPKLNPPKGEITEIRWLGPGEQSNYNRITPNTRQILVRWHGGTL